MSQIQEGDVIQKSMSNLEQLNAQNMLDQSVVYLYNAYREEGYTSEQSKERVADALERTYKKYIDRGVIVPNKKHSIFNPKEIIDDIIKEVKAYDTQDIGLRNMIRKLEQLKISL